MKRSWSGLGHRLGSVATRYRHPWGPRWPKRIDGGQIGGGWWRLDHQVHQQEKLAAPHDERVSRLEAIFFLSQQPQSSRKLAQLAGLADGTKARTLVRTLNRRYDSEGSAFRIEEVAGGFQLMTRLKFAPWLRRLHSASTEVRLSAPAMETLAVVAYRQPILRADLEAIRGVQSGEVLRQLIERDLVRIVGRSNELGRPFLYGTTRQFLQVFGLRHLDELPRADVLRIRRPSAEPPQNAADPPSHTTIETIPSSIQAPVAAEETHVKTSITKEPQRKASANHQGVATENLRHDELFGREVIARREDDEEEDLDEDEEEDEEDDDLDEQPWEEVEEEDDLDEDEDEDDDEDWDDEDWDEDEDEDWDDEEEDEDWDDEDEEEEDEKE